MFFDDTHTHTHIHRRTQTHNPGAYCARVITLKYGLIINNPVFCAAQLDLKCRDHGAGETTVSKFGVSVSSLLALC